MSVFESLRQKKTMPSLGWRRRHADPVIRARFRMFKKIRALSAEGRLSAKILATMPFLFGGLVFMSKPEFYLDAADDPLFFPFLAVALILEIVGCYIMYKLVNFRV